MFSGLVQKVGVWEGINVAKRGRSASIRHDSWPEPLTIGESISVQGVCLTVVSSSGSNFQCNLLGETIAKTTLGKLNKGDLVNLERALKVNDRLGGHFVLGHVDGIGRLRKIARKGDDRILEIECDLSIMQDVVKKGSVALDGISLTVVDVTDNSFYVHIIPHTFESTSLRERSEGDGVNIETDLLVKSSRVIMERMSVRRRGLTEADLRGAGF